MEDSFPDPNPTRVSPPSSKKSWRWGDRARTHLQHSDNPVGSTTLPPSRNIAHSLFAELDVHNFAPLLRSCGPRCCHRMVDASLAALDAAANRHIKRVGLG